MANLFQKLCTKFYPPRPSFVGDMMKNILVSFSGTIITMEYKITNNVH